MKGVNGLSIALLIVLCTIARAKDSIICSPGELPCDDHTECVPSDQWCDDDLYCDDSSDEGYCAKAGIFNRDPNGCSNSITHFMCIDGVCVPQVARCNGYLDCKDGSDENDCETTLTPESVTELLPDVSENKVGGKVKDNDDDDSSDTDDDSSQGNDDRFEEKGDGDNRIKDKVDANEIDTFPVSEQRKEALDSRIFHTRDSVNKGVRWLLSLRNSNYGWGTSTARALIALGLANPKRFMSANDDSNLMKKQLQVLVAMDMFRNRTTPVPLHRLALYVNAMFATCQDPENLYGINLVRELRARTTTAQNARHRQTHTPFINPIVHLTLCLAGRTTSNDAYHLTKTLRLQSSELKWHDMQAISIMAFSCIKQSPHHRNSYMNEMHHAVNLLHQRMSTGNVGNIYSTALTAQALLSFPKSGNWDRQSTIQYLEQNQRENGSFGDLLATYYILPVLSGRSLIDLRNLSCHTPVKSDGLTSLEQLDNFQGLKYFVHYSLYFNEPPTLSYNLQLEVPENTSFFDIMRLAERHDPKFKFRYEREGNSVNVYSISGIPNDAERGYYWQLYANVLSRGTTPTVRLRRPILSEYKTGSLKDFYPKHTDHVCYWYKPIA